MPSTWPPMPTGAMAACRDLPPASPTSTTAWAGCSRRTSSSSPDALPWVRRRLPPTSPITWRRLTSPAETRRPRSTAPWWASSRSRCRPSSSPPASSPSRPISRPTALPAGGGEGRRGRRQAAARADGHGDAAIHAGVHEVQQSRQRGASAGAPRVSPARPREAPSSERDAGPHGTAILTTDLEALAANYRRLRDLAAPAECAAVVKADAYGLGMADAAPALARAGCKIFFVATLGDANAVRALAPSAFIYVFAGLMPGPAELYRAHDLRPVLNSAEEIREWASFCAARGEKRACAVHIDSGMNRLGLSADEVDRVAEAPELWQAMTLSLVMSHLACADEAQHPKSEAQRKIFDRLRAGLPAALAGLANAPGIPLGRAYAYDLARPGIALYGGKPSRPGENPVPP